MKNKPIIYIIGDGRSGSTILEEYISENLGGIKIGEARRFWFRYYEAETYCECGEIINKCNFWNNVESSLQNEVKGGVLHKKINQHLAYKKMKNVVQNRKPDDFISDLQKSFYNAINENTNENIIIDSSKLYSWGINLDLWNSENVLFIHLVRNIKDVANSWKKDLLLPEYIDKKVKMPKRGLKEHLLSWFKINLTTLSYFHNKSNYIYVDYKEFCENPQSLIQSIISHPIMSEIKINNNVSSHGIGGNPVRKSSSGNLQISYKSSSKNLTFIEKGIYSISSVFYNLVKSRYVK